MTKEADLAALLAHHILGLTRARDRDFSLRQLAVLLTCYTSGQPQTIRGLAAELATNKPAMTRSVDRLEAADFVQRKDDPADRRSVLIYITPDGKRYAARFFGGTKPRRRRARK